MAYNEKAEVRGREDLPWLVVSNKEPDPWASILAEPNRVCILFDRLAGKQGVIFGGSLIMGASILFAATFVTYTYSATVESWVKRKDRKL